MRAAHSGCRVSKGGFRFNNSVRTAAPGYDIFNVAMTTAATSYSSYVNAAVAFLGADQALWQHLVLVVPATAGGTRNTYGGYGLGSVGCSRSSSVSNCWTMGVDATNVRAGCFAVFVHAWLTRARARARTQLNLWTHELGHNIGLMHSGALSTGGTWVEYADVSCAMGFCA